MGWSINNLKKANWKDAAAAIVTGGASTNITAATGKTAGQQVDAIKDISSGSLGGKITAADPAAYQSATDNLLNPVADQFNQFGQNSAVTSNVDPAFRDYQLGLAQQLQNQANGQGPSLAQMQLQQSTDRTLNQSLGAIRSATGANAGLSARTAALAGAQGLGSAANQSGQLRLQEQQAAQQQLAGLANQGRTGDLTTNAQSLQAQQATQANRLAGIQGLSGVRQAQLGTAQNIYAAQNGAAIGTANNSAANTRAVVGGITNTLATGLGSMSAVAPVAQTAAPAVTAGTPEYDPNKQLA